MCRKQNFINLLNAEYKGLYGNNAHYETWLSQHINDYKNQQFCAFYYYGPHSEKAIMLADDISYAESLARDSQASVVYVMDLGNNKKLLPRTVFRYEIP